MNRALCGTALVAHLFSFSTPTLAAAPATGAKPAQAQSDAEKRTEKEKIRREMHQVAASKRESGWIWIGVGAALIAGGTAMTIIGANSDSSGVSAKKIVLLTLGPTTGLYGIYSLIIGIDRLSSASSIESNIRESNSGSYFGNDFYLAFDHSTRAAVSGAIIRF